MKILTSTTISLFLMLSPLCSFAASGNAMLLGDTGNGKKLLTEKCSSCHIQKMGGDGSGIFTRKNHIVKSVEGLIGRVNGCNQNTQANLSKDQVNDIVKYLNETYYKF